MLYCKVNVRGTFNVPQTFNCNLLNPLFFRLHLREKQDFLNRDLAREQHRQTVDAEADTCRWRHTVFECAEEILIKRHRFLVTAFSQSELILKALSLVDRIVQLGIGIGYFLTIYKELKTLNESGFGPVLFGEWRHFHRIVDEESRLNEGAFYFCTKNFVDQFGFAH